MQSYRPLVARPEVRLRPAEGEHENTNNATIAIQCVCVVYADTESHHSLRSRSSELRSNTGSPAAVSLSRFSMAHVPCRAPLWLGASRGKAEDDFAAVRVGHKSRGEVTSDSERIPTCHSDLITTSTQDAEWDPGGSNGGLDLSSLIAVCCAASRIDGNWGASASAFHGCGIASV